MWVAIVFLIYGIICLFLNMCCLGWLILPVGYVVMAAIITIGVITVMSD